MKQNAFSLVELSIVLVILGLLTGGILAGQSLIRAAELRSVSSEYARYVTSVQTFRDKYFALPGDMRNATAFWGVPSTGTCVTGTGVGTETCDGDGSGTLEVSSGLSRYAESFMFWQHMANAGLIEGSYTGKNTGGNVRETIAGENAPVSKISNASWFVETNGSTTSTTWFDNNISKTTMLFGGITNIRRPETGILTAEEQWNIDKKMDDGLPGRGKLTATKNGGSFAANCSTTNSGATAEYDFSNSGKECIAVFTLD